MTSIRTASATIISAFILATGAATAAGPAKSTDCTIHLQTLAAPTDPEGEEFGNVNCPRGLGKGVQHDTFKVSPTSDATGAVNGRYTQYYAAGTIRGTFKLHFTATSATTLSYTGTATITGGTGTLRNVTGRVTLTCTSHDGIAHTDCTAKTTLSHR